MTTKIKYIKGPWILSTVEGSDCLMVGGGDGSEVVADIRTSWPTRTIEANARLVQAAPELFGLLKNVQECMRKCMPLIDDPEDLNHNGAQTYCGEWLDEVNELISRIETTDVWLYQKNKTVKNSK